MNIQIERFDNFEKDLERERETSKCYNQCTGIFITAPLESFSATFAK